MSRHEAPGHVAPRQIGLADDPYDLEFNPLESLPVNTLSIAVNGGAETTSLRW